MNNAVVAYTVIFLPVFAFGLLWGWVLRGQWRKAGLAIDQIIKSEDAAAEWAALIRAVQIEIEER